MIDDFGGSLMLNDGQRARLDSAVQRIRGAAERHEAGVHEAAEFGTRGAGGPLPYLERIQASFGRHDVSNVQAHVGGAAKDATAAMGAEAYASGNHVAFGASPDLATAAHEAAHIVQQRGGVQLKDGIGQVGDAYEQHADAVAARVVQGKSAEGLLDTKAGGSAVRDGVQHNVAVDGDHGGGGSQKGSDQGSGLRRDTLPTVPAVPRSPVQRLFISKGLDADIAYKEVYDYAVAQLGADSTVVAPGSDAKITATNASEPLYVLLHGGRPSKDKQGTVLDWKPADLAEVLGQMGFDSANHTADITLLSCYAGFSHDGQVKPFAATFAGLLQSKSYAGKVFAVEGAIYGPKTGGKDPSDDDAQLWQQDPTWLRLTMIHELIKSLDEEILEIEQALLKAQFHQPDPEPDDAKSVAVVGKWLAYWMDGLEMFPEARKGLAGDDDFDEELDTVKDNAMPHLALLTKTVTSTKETLMTKAGDPEELLGACEDLRARSEELGSLIEDYEGVQLKNGARKGSQLFKPAVWLSF